MFSICIRRYFGSVFWSLMYRKYICDPIHVHCFYMTYDTRFNVFFIKENQILFFSKNIPEQLSI